MVQGTAKALSLREDPRYHRGLELYRAGEFFACHEVLEEVWTPMRGPHRLFLQALIHFAVAHYHHQRGNPLGAELQMRKALLKIAAYLPEYEDVDTAALYREGQHFLASHGTSPAPTENQGRDRP